MSPKSKRIFVELKRHGVLLLADAHLPSLSALVVGEPVRGSWWAHPRAQDIFDVYDELTDHCDVMTAKLVSGKVTYIHRALWPNIVAAGSAREPWQMIGLSPEAHELLGEVELKPVVPGRGMSKLASELEASLLVFSEQFHSESGAHVRRLESWNGWAERVGAPAGKVTPSSARAALEEIVARLNQACGGRGRLPWIGKNGERKA